MRNWSLNSDWRISTDVQWEQRVYHFNLITHYSVMCLQSALGYMGYYFAV